MNNALAGIRQARSFIAGLLIGLSIVIPVLAMTGASRGDGQILWILTAPVVIGFALALQIVVTRGPRRRRLAEALARILPAGFTALGHEQ